MNDKQIFLNTFGYDGEVLDTTVDDLSTVQGSMTLSANISEMLAQYVRYLEERNKKIVTMLCDIVADVKELNDKYATRVNE